MSATRTRDARLVALDAVSGVLDQGVFLTDAEAFGACRDPRDAAFARRLAYGVLRWYGALEWLAQQLLDRPLRRRDSDVQRLILLGLYQLWQEDTPDHAAIHASAECARLLGKPWAVGLINGVLRSFQRQNEALLARMRETDRHLAHPEWLLKALQNDWPEHWREIASANNRQAPLWLRINRRRTTRTAMEERLRSEGFDTARHQVAAEAIRVAPPVPVQRLPGFYEGLVSVQDAAAQLAARLLAPGPGQRVLDACAAPGGKTCHLLELEPALELVALDRDARRAEAIGENLERLGLSASVKVADAAQPGTWWDGRRFDRILLDAPCSATGVIRRHPEIKWLRDPRQVTEATEHEAGLLDELWPLLGAGGILVYATCSVLRCENSEQIHSFLESHADAECIGPVAFPGRPEPFGCQILPGDHDMDGFYYAVLRKSAQPAA